MIFHFVSGLDTFDRTCNKKFLEYKTKFCCKKVVTETGLVGAILGGFCMFLG